MQQELYDYLSKTQCNNKCAGVDTLTFKLQDDCFIHQVGNIKFIVWTKPTIIPNSIKEPTELEKMNFKNKFQNFQQYSICTYLVDEFETAILEQKVYDINIIELA
jgi:hypothetical protein